VLGLGHDEFWAWCNQGELRLPLCEGCGELAWPVFEVCEHCGGRAFSWQRMSERGKVASCCTFNHDYQRGMLPVPYDSILVELEEGALFVCDPADFGGEDISYEIPVTESFLPCADGAGPFRLPVFSKA
jgi:uncharacterized protein